MEGAVCLRVPATVAVLVPTHYLDRNQPARTTWTKKGAQLVRSQQYKDAEVAAKAGEHYIAVKPESDEYFLFPEDVGPFCHSWGSGKKKIVPTWW